MEKTEKKINTTEVPMGRPEEQKRPARMTVEFMHILFLYLLDC